MNMGFLYHNLPDNKHAKNGNLKKLSRDLYSGWTIKDNKPHYGLKEHDVVDIKNGFVLSINMS